MSSPAVIRPCHIPSASKPWMRVACWLVVATLLMIPRVGASQTLTPPAPPEVAPVISAVYPDDADGDRIDDVLSRRVEEIATSLSPSMGAGRRRAVSTDDETLAVELIFRAPVTQEQIDAFVEAGGRITYLYKALSYGWKGRIPARAIASLPALMGPSLVQVERAMQVEPYMDQATRTGRVRPIWQHGFAGSVAGFDGDPSITIGFVVDGIDGTHPDLAGRCAYWSDLTGANEASPVDNFGHGSLAAGVAVGTGGADRLLEPELRYTYVGDFASDLHVVDPISFDSSSYVQVNSRASWFGASAILAQIRWIKGEYFADLDWIRDFVWGGSALDLTNSYLTNTRQVFSVLLEVMDSGELDQVVITTSISKYPTLDDGFPRFRGVAPACRWASARIDENGEAGENEDVGESLDDLVFHREANNIKIINISHGLVEEGYPSQSQSLRDKVNSAVRNGVVVVSAAGNSAYAPTQEYRVMADPPRAALAITVGASDDENALTYYSSAGYLDPDPASGEDFKPDLIAPGGSIHQTGMMSVDTGFADGFGIPDEQPDDYTSAYGTSFASPFVAGCAALVIDAMQQQGVVWDFHSAEQPLYVKMLLCATASETNAEREEWFFNPTLQRARSGPEGYPLGKDRFEGYGLINADAAVEAVCRTYVPSQDTGAEFGDGPADRRVWARNLTLAAGIGIETSLDNPIDGDFDLYLYSAVPSETGTPVILASSTKSGTGVDEALSYTADADTPALLVVKRISGSGAFKIESALPAPPSAQNVSATARQGSDTTIRLQAEDDGAPNPPGQLTYVIASLPAHGRLLHVSNGAAITTVPTTLGPGIDQVLYQPDAGYTGEDSFTYRADDGGVAPAGGASNAATVTLTVRAAATQTATVELQISRSEDDVSATCAGSWNLPALDILRVGVERCGMRFVDAPIPPGSEILDARLELYFFRDTVEFIDGVIQAEAADDAAELTTAERHLCKLPLTQASASWAWDPGTYDTRWETSPDLSNVIQEVVDRGDWSASNAIVLVYWSRTQGARDRRFASYDRWAPDPTYAPKLIVTYAY